jgi:tetratricopeptide (TPR) repeat protein
MSALLLVVLLMQAGSADAVRLYQEGKYAEAAAAYRELVRKDPGSADAWAGLGRSLLQLRNPDAIPTLGRALQLKPGDPDLERTLAYTYMQTGNMPAAVALLEPLAEKSPKDAEALYLLGEAMYRGGFFQRALELLGQSLALHPDRPKAENMRAVSLAKVGRTAEAEVACRRLLEKPPAGWDLDVALTYVEILDEAGRLTEAVPYVDKVLHEQPRDPIAHFWKARLLLQSGRLSDAATEAEQSVTLAPGLPFGRNLLLQIYRKQNRMGDAQRQADWLREYSDRRTERGR